MGTTIHVKPANAVSIVKEIFQRVDNEMSEWKLDSPLSKVNAEAGKSAVQCPLELCSAIALSLSISQQTDGAFDPTWASLWDLWDFNTPSLPLDTEINARLPLVNWKNVVLDGNAVFLKHEGMSLGLGGIAKGIALNKSRVALLDEGIDDFMIVAGGQVLVHGIPRRIGIRKPDGLTNEFVEVLELANTCISTSGDYEKYFELGGVRYHHIIDPRNGFPARGTRSVSVIATDAAIADALSTALFVMGPDKAVQLVNTISGVEALIIDSNDVMHLSDYATHYFVVSKDSP